MTLQDEIMEILNLSSKFLYKTGIIVVSFENPTETKLMILSPAIGLEVGGPISRLLIYFTAVIYLFHKSLYVDFSLVELDLRPKCNAATMPSLSACHGERKRSWRRWWPATKIFAPAKVLIRMTMRCFPGKMLGKFFEQIKIRTGWGKWDETHKTSTKTTNVKSTPRFFCSKDWLIYKKPSFVSKFLQTSDVYQCCKGIYTIYIYIYVYAFKVKYIDICK